MNRHPESAPQHDDIWLREWLRDDAERAPYLDDAGFTARVVAALPAPRRRWLDGLSGVVIVAVLGLALLFVAGLLQAPLANLAENIAEPFSAALARPSPGALLSLLAPLLALYLAGAALLEG
jgi:hypothetical protein